MIPALAVQIQGQSVVTADNMNTWVQGGALANDMRTLTGLPGMTILAAGINTVNDGLGGLFFWNATSNEPDDNLDFIVPHGTFQGAWWRLTLVVSGANGGPAGNFGTLTVTGQALFQSDVQINGILSVSSAIVAAAGTTQATATQLGANINAVTTVGAGSGVILPSINLGGFPLKAGTSIKVYNRGANVLSVYPPLGQQIETAGVNAPLAIFNGGVAIYDYLGSNQWYVS